MSECGEMRFSLKREEIPVVLETEDGTEKKAVLREMSGRERDAYLNKMSSKVNFNSKGELSSIKNYDGLQASLLSMCLYDEDGKLIPIEEIQKFPTKTQATLYKEAQKMNALDSKTEAVVKND